MCFGNVYKKSKQRKKLHDRLSDQDMYRRSKIVPTEYL